MLVLRDVAGQRHGQVEAQGQFGGLGLLEGAGGLDEINLLLGLAAGLGQQHIDRLEYRSFDRQEAEPLIPAPDGIQKMLEGDLVPGQQFHHAGRGLGLDQAHFSFFWGQKNREIRAGAPI